MPAFTFEKISPPNQHITPIEAHKPSKPRGVLVRMLDRFVESRVKRSLLEEKAAMPVLDRGLDRKPAD